MHAGERNACNIQNESQFARLNNVGNDRNGAIPTSLKAEMEMKTDNHFQERKKKKINPDT